MQGLRESLAGLRAGFALARTGRGVLAAPPVFCLPVAGPALAWCSAYFEREFGHAVHAARHLVARLESADASGRTRENQVARLERHRLRNVADNVGHRPDHFVEIALLTDFAIDRQPDAARARMAGFLNRKQRRNRTRRVEALGPVPRTALFLGDGLQVAACQVDADTVTPDVIQRLVRRNRLSALADRDDQFDFVMQVRR